MVVGDVVDERRDSDNPDGKLMAMQRCYDEDGDGKEAADPAVLRSCRVSASGPGFYAIQIAKLLAKRAAYHI